MKAKGKAIARAGAEFLIIVLGVAVALAAENWREAQVDRQTEGQYLQRLLAELEEARPTIAGNHEKIVSASVAIDSLLQFAGADALTAPDVVSRLSVAASDYAFVTPSVVPDLTYREMLSTGTLSLIQDPAIRGGVSTYYRDAYRAAAIFDEARRAGVTRWSDLVHEATGQTVSGGLDPSDADVAARLRGLVSNEDVAGPALRTAKSNLGSVRYWLDVLLTSTDEMIRLLEAQQG